MGDVLTALALVLLCIGNFIGAVNIRRLARKLDSTITRQADALEREVDLTRIVNDMVQRERDTLLREMKR